MVEMEDAFDSVVIGTGLGEALLSAALSAAGHSVLHLEPGSGYGRADGAMSLDRLIEFISSPDGALAGFGNVSISPTTSSLYDSVKGSGAKGFTLELAPKLLPARGALVETLIRSGVGRYVEFRGLQGIHILLSDAFEKVSYASLCYIALP